MPLVRGPHAEVPRDVARQELTEGSQCGEVLDVRFAPGPRNLELDIWNEQLVEQVARYEVAQWRTHSYSRVVARRPLAFPLVGQAATERWHHGTEERSRRLPQELVNSDIRGRSVTHGQAPPEMAHERCTLGAIAKKCGEKGRHVPLPLFRSR